ncbi:HD domain-containing protein [Micromonospora humida]|uniref:HD domain-containing protein n=1 Tax=Micromonospora humida TaxID=2809018 RepID=UPI003672F18D
MDLVEQARRVSEDVLARTLPRRWRHVEAVAAKARRAEVILPEGQRAILLAAAWLHDVGYSPDIKSSGLHALDGARWLRRYGFNERIAGLVAYHSCAIFEAEERGLDEELRAEFSDEDSALRDTLWYADMTTGPDGQEFQVIERLAEIRSRYGNGHLVTRFWARAESTLIDAVRRTEERLEQHHYPM